jgi:hypothetical protein
MTIFCWVFYEHHNREVKPIVEGYMPFREKKDN